MSVKLVVCDLDGTLFRTETVDIEAMNRALELNGHDRREGKEILNLIGLTLEDASKELLNTDDEEVINKYKSDVVRFEQEEIRKYGKLYDGVLDGLKKLKERGYTLCICSNGGEDYIDPICSKFGLFEILDDVSVNSENLTKPERVGELKRKFGAEKFVMVGDRSSDLDAGRQNGAIVIGAAYGYGPEEIKDADYIAEGFKGVVEILEKIFV
jgi:phosphoglycolate phosphatase